MKLLLENWRKHLKEVQDHEYDVGAQAGGKNKVYVLYRRQDRIVDIVGVYSSKELAKKGRKSDIANWRGQPDRMAQPPEEENYEIEEFDLDDFGEPAEKDLSEKDLKKQVEQFYKYWDDYVKSSEYHVEGEAPSSKKDVDKWAEKQGKAPHIAVAVWEKVEEEIKEEPYTFQTAVYGKTGRFK